MITLQQTQAAFQDYVLGDGAVAPGLAAAVREQGGLDAQRRLFIYHNAYRVRMREALEEAYERTWTYVGDSLFAELADAYVAEHPSAFANLRWFGGEFPAMVRRRLPEHAFVAELAAFEWALGLAFDAPDAAIAGQHTFASLAPQDWNELRLMLHPAVQLVHTQFNSVAIWQALGEEREPPAPEVLVLPCTWLVWRRDNQPHFRSLDPLEADALAAVARGETFGQICEHAARAAPDAAERVAACLREWMGQSLLRG